jgi:hypothetical protein
MNDPAIATAADYADAMVTARKSKNALLLGVLLMLLIQLGLFFIARYTNFVIASPSTTQPTTAPNPKWTDGIEYLVGASAFLGVVLTIVLSFVLLLIVNIMLVGRLIGVARLTSSYVWCLVLLVLLFPWQAFLSNATFSDPNFKIPGVLYTWDELRLFAKFGMTTPAEGSVLVLKWARFVVLPAIAIIIALRIQMKSNRGLRQAFGETEPETTV